MEACTLKPDTIKYIQELMQTKKPTSFRYSFSLLKESCKLKLTIENVCVTWVFSPAFPTSQSKYKFEPPTNICLVSEDMMVPAVVFVFKAVKHKFFENKIAICENILIESDVFLKDSNTPFVFSLIDVVEETESFQIFGEDNRYSAICSRILNELKVTGSIYIPQCPADEALQYEKISKTEMVVVEFLHTTPSNLFECMGKHLVATVKSFRIENINELIHIWMKSHTNNISVFILKIKEAEENSVENLFGGLEVVPGKKKPCCGYLNTCGEARCQSKKSVHLQNIGAKLVRHDDAVADIFYSSSLQEFSFLMLINYPDRPDRYKVAQDEFYSANKIYREQEKSREKLSDSVQTINRRLARVKLFAHPVGNPKTDKIIRDAENRERDWETTKAREHRNYIDLIERPAREKIEERSKYGYLKLPKLKNGN